MTRVGTHERQGNGIPSSAASSPRVLTLENEWIALQIIPELGGKITSLRSRQDGAEWLLPPLRAYGEARRNGSFAASDGGGFEECLPGIAESADVPDHGEVWRLPWVGGSQHGRIALSVESAHPALRLSRCVGLSGTSVRMDYAVENLEPVPASFLWSAHPLLQVAEGDCILLPPEIAKVRVESSRGEALLTEDGFCSWPLAQTAGGGEIDLSRVGPPDGHTARKLFAGPFTRDVACGLYRPALKQGIVFRFSPEHVPYVGLWMCQGAWPENAARQQYTVAIEPTTANTDALHRAQANGTDSVLLAGRRLTWSVSITIAGTDGDLDLDAFCATLGGKHD